MLISKKILFILFSGLFIGISGAEFKAGQSVDFKGDVKEDLYVGSGQVSVTSNVSGDANLAGGDVIYKGRVTGDAQLAGGNVRAEISGADDVRIMCGQSTLDIKNSGDVLLACGNTAISSASDIKGDLYIMSGSATLDGRVRGNVHIWGGDVSLHGTIDGNLEIHTESAKISALVKGKSKLSSRTLTIQPEARFQGAVEYWSEKTTDFHDSVKGGDATFNKNLRGERKDYMWEKQWYWTSIWFGLWLPLSTALIIFLLMYFMPLLMGQSSEKFLAAPVAALGYGVLYYFMIPVLAILFFITIIGIPIGILLCAIHGFSIAYGRSIASAIFAGALAKKYHKTWSKGMFVLIGVGIYIGLNLLFMIPAVGMLLNILAVFAAVGALVQVLFERYRSSKTSAEKV